MSSMLKILIAAACTALASALPPIIPSSYSADILAVSTDSTQEYHGTLNMLMLKGVGFSRTSPGTDLFSKYCVADSASQFCANSTTQCQYSCKQNNCCLPPSPPPPPPSPGPPAPNSSCGCAMSSTIFKVFRMLLLAKEEGQCELKSGSGNGEFYVLKFKDYISDPSLAHFAGELSKATDITSRVAAAFGRASQPPPSPAHSSQLLAIDYCINSHGPKPVPDHLVMVTKVDEKIINSTIVMNNFDTTPPPPSLFTPPSNCDC